MLKMMILDYVPTDRTADRPKSRFYVNGLRVTEDGYAAVIPCVSEWTYLKTDSYWDDVDTARTGLRRRYTVAWYRKNLAFA